MHELITDQSFDLNRTSEYILSIQVSLDGFSFSVIDDNDNRLLMLYSSQATISTEKFIARRFDEWVNSEEILSRQFAEVRVQYCTGNFTTVPESFFISEKQNEIAALLFEQEITSQVVTVHPKNTASKVLFSIPANFPSEIAEKFGSYSLEHPAAVLAEKGSSFFIEKEKGALLYFTPKSFLLLLYSGKKLLLANSYNYSHPNDVVYYLMAALNQYQIKPGDLKLILSGEISSGDKTEMLLREYFSKTEFGSPEINYNPEIFKNIHRFINLL